MHWSLIISCGLITFFSRFSMIFFLKKDVMNDRTKKILSFVPSAIFPAIIFPPILLDNEGFLDLENNPKILAALIAIIAGYFSKNIIATIFAGLTSYWFLIFFYF
jgi:branched-subunit amino acid transport protein